MLFAVEGIKGCPGGGPSTDGVAFGCLNEDLVMFNVRGERIIVRSSLLRSFPDSALWRMVQAHCEQGDKNTIDREGDAHKLAKREHFLDVDPAAFHVVLNFMAFGELHVPMTVPLSLVQRLLDYFCLETAALNVGGARGGDGDGPVSVSVPAFVDSKEGRKGKHLFETTTGDQIWCQAEDFKGHSVFKGTLLSDTFQHWPPRWNSKQQACVNAPEACVSTTRESTTSRTPPESRLEGGVGLFADTVETETDALLDGDVVSNGDGVGGVGGAVGIVSGSDGVSLSPQKTLLPSANGIFQLPVFVNAQSFRAVLRWYRKGILSRPPSVAAGQWEKTLRFFRLPEKWVFFEGPEGEGGIRGSGDGQIVGAVSWFDETEQEAKAVMKKGMVALAEQLGDFIRSERLKGRRQSCFSLVLYWRDPGHNDIVPRDWLSPVAEAVKEIPHYQSKIDPRDVDSDRKLQQELYATCVEVLEWPAKQLAVFADEVRDCCGRGSTTLTTIEIRAWLKNKVHPYDVPPPSRKPFCCCRRRQKGKEGGSG